MCNRYRNRQAALIGDEASEYDIKVVAASLGRAS